MANRWYHVTPERFLVGLLAVEGGLLLSEQMGWFGRDEWKGWPVLIAIATVGLVVLLLLCWFAFGLALRRRFQFGIRALLLLILAVAILCTWLPVKIRQAKRQRAAVRATEERGAQVLYDWEMSDPSSPPGPEWLLDYLGTDFFAGISLVQPRNLRDSMREFNDDDMVLLTTGAPGVRDLSVAQSQVTDAGLVHLKGLRRLNRLRLNDTEITDAGLAHLADLTRLEHLGLSGTQVTDAGLAHLDGLIALNSLALGATRITDAVADPVVRSPAFMRSLEPRSRLKAVLRTAMPPFFP